MPDTVRCDRRDARTVSETMVDKLPERPLMFETSFGYDEHPFNGTIFFAQWNLFPTISHHYFFAQYMLESEIAMINNNILLYPK